MKQEEEEEGEGEGLVPAARVEREMGGGETGVDSPCSLIRGQNID